MKFFTILEKLTEKNSYVSSKILHENIEKIRECEEFENCNVSIVDLPAISLYEDFSLHNPATYLGGRKMSNYVIECFLHKRHEI